MIRNVFLVILCFCTFVLAHGADYEQDVFLSVKIDPVDMFDEWKARDNLLHALKEGDVAKADAALDFLSQAKVPESAIDSLELLQVNFILGRYDLAVPQFANMLMKAGKKVRYSFADDSLFAYLRSETRIGAYYRDRSSDRDREERLVKTESYLKKAMQADVKQEYKDLAYILYRLQSWYYISDKERWIYISTVFTPVSKDSLANLINIRSEFGIDYHNEMDTLGVDLMLEKMQAFCESYPESEYSEWLKKISKKIKELQKNYKKVRNYYVDKIYTGGFGIEGFISANASGALLGVPLQYSRFILTPFYIWDKDFDKFFITAGFDLYENKKFKVQPYVGGWNFFTVGLQVDFRFYMSDVPGEFNSAGYWALKLRYMGAVYTPEKQAEEDKAMGKREWTNRIFIGLGLHFW